MYLITIESSTGTVLEVYQDAPDMEKLLLDTVQHRYNVHAFYSKLPIQSPLHLPPSLPHLSPSSLSSVCGWDHVIQGLVVVGFNLMDSFTPKSASVFKLTTLKYYRPNESFHTYVHTQRHPSAPLSTELVVLVARFF